MTKEKETVQLNFNGKTITINRNYSGHRFTDAELQKLEKGETITIKAHSAKKNEDYETEGNIAKQHYNGFTYWGFKRLPKKPKEKVEGTYQGQTIKFNRVWGGHRFTDEEVDTLLKGEVITFTLESGTEVTGNLSLQSYDDNIFWGFKPESGNDNEKAHHNAETDSDFVSFTEPEKSITSDAEKKPIEKDTIDSAEGTKESAHELFDF